MSGKEATSSLRGITNAGNSCFFNCIVQSLLNTPKFNTYITALESGEEDSVAKWLRDLSRKLREGTTAAVDGRSEIDRLKRFGVHTVSRFFNGEQQDAHEFQQAMLTELESLIAKKNQMTQHHNIISVPLRRLPAIRFVRAADSAVKAKAPPTLINPLEGDMLGTVSCKNCKYKNQTVYHFTDITLSLSPQTLYAPSMDVPGYMKQFTESENIDDWKCEKCYKMGAVKRLQILKGPEILCLHIRRLIVGSDGRTKKIQSHVKFGTQLDIGEFCVSFDDYTSNGVRRNGMSNGRETAKEGNQYRLSSVVVHLGESGRGHYIVHKRKGKQWHEISDDVVTESSWESTRRLNASLLFYTRFTASSKAAAAPTVMRKASEDMDGLAPLRALLGSQDSFREERKGMESNGKGRRDIKLTNGH